MSLLRALGLVRRAAPPAEPASDPIVPADEGRAVFQEAVLKLEDLYQLRVVITRIIGTTIRVSYSARIDLPFRVHVIAPTLKRNCWGRVVRQDEGVADIELPEGPD